MPLSISAELQRYMQHMPEGDDLTLIVLKGHLLIEEILWRIVRAMVTHGDLLKKELLKYRELAALARSMCWEQQHDSIWDFICGLNALRNTLAHQLEPVDLEKKVRSLLNKSTTLIDDPQLRNESLSLSAAQRLKDGIIVARGFLASFEKDVKVYRLALDCVHGASA